MESMPKHRIAYVLGSASLLNGGVTTAAAAFGRASKAQGAGELAAFAMEDERSARDAGLWDGIPITFCRTRSLGVMRYCPELRAALEEFRPELIHTHGLWLHPMYAAYRHTSRQGIPAVISPQGMLDGWAISQSRWKKAMMGWAFQRRQLERARVMHALTPAEVAGFRAYGLHGLAAIVPNGVRIPTEPSDAAGVVKQAMVARGCDKTLLFFGRLHPKKGLRELIEGWARAKAAFHEGDGWGLAIVGWGDPVYEAEIKALAESSGQGRSIAFFGPIFDAEKDRTIAGCDAFILPSFSEGLPVAVLEAWARARPVVMTRFCYLPEGFASRAALEIEPESASVQEGLASLFAMSSTDRTAMGANGRALVEQRFSEEVVGRMMADVYAWALGGGAAPGFVERY